MAWAQIVAPVMTALGANGGDSTAANTTGATVIVVSVNWYGVTPPVVTDLTMGNTLTPRAPVTSGNVNVTLYSKVAPLTSAAHVFRVAGTGVYTSIGVTAWSGAGVFDGGSAGAVATGVLSLSDTRTPGAAECLAVTALALNSGVGTATGFACDSGYTFAAVSNSPSVYLGGGLAAKALTGTSATTPVWSWLTLSDVAMTVATWTPAAVATGVDRGDLNTELAVSLGYPVPTADLTTLVSTYLKAHATGDATADMQALIKAATR